MSAACPSTTFIYGLVDPRTNRIRYIGKANDPQKRYGAHWSPSTWRESHKDRWCRQLQALGLKPILVILEEVPVHAWKEAEVWWIARFQLSGDLVNGTIGGDGPASAESTARGVAKRIGRKQPAGSGDKKRATWTRRMAEDAEFADAIRARRSELSIARGARPPCMTGEANPLAKLTEGNVVEARERCAAGESATALAQEFGVSLSSMHNALMGQTWRAAGGPLHQPKPNDAPRHQAVVDRLASKANHEIAKELGVSSVYVGTIRYREKRRASKLQEMV